MPKEQSVNPMEAQRIHEIMQGDITAQTSDERSGRLSVYSCPECGGALWQFGTSHSVRFHCHCGHVWSPDSLLAVKCVALEAGLCNCVRLLGEKATLAAQIAVRARSAGDEETAASLEEKIALEEGYIRLIREKLLDTMPNLYARGAIVEEIVEGGR